MNPGSDNRCWRNLHRQVQFAVRTFEASVSESAVHHLGGFDAHGIHNPDAGWLLGRLRDGSNIHASTPESTALMTGW